VTILGLIPARGGSKALPGKNIAALAGTPLIAYTCRAALESRSLDRVVVSSDSAEIAAVARREGVEVPFVRPASIARDDTPMIDVVHHACMELGRTGYVPDAVAVLQPTSPLRTAAHIDGAVELLRSSGADTVVSVVRVPHHFVPASVMRLEGGWLVPYESLEAPLRRQQKPVLYARNGPAVLLLTRKAIDAGSLYGGTVVGFEMDAAESIDIDTVDDLAAAEFWLARRGARDA
jgi:CMP-N,N'-diacetyllegionaminic acid synthase